MGGKGSGRRPSVPYAFEPDTQKQKTLDLLLRTKALPPIDTHDGTQVRERLAEYNALCLRAGQAPTVAGTAVALGVSRATMWTWRAGHVRQEPEVLAAIEEQMSLINAYMEQAMTENGVNPVSGIFLLKNNFENYRDAQQIELHSDRAALTTKQLEEKYARAIEVEYTEVSNDSSGSEKE